MAQTSHYIHQIQKVLGFIFWKMSLLETRCTCVGVCRQIDTHLHPVYIHWGPGKCLCSAGLFGISGSSVHVHHMPSGLV